MQRIESGAQQHRFGDELHPSLANRHQSGVAGHTGSPTPGRATLRHDAHRTEVLEAGLEHHHRALQTECRDRHRRAVVQRSDRERLRPAGTEHPTERRRLERGRYRQV